MPNAKLEIPPVKASYPWNRVIGGIASLILIGFLASSIGSVDIPLLQSVKIVINKLPGIELPTSWSNEWETILWQLRIPRVVLAAIVGATLAMSGATYQGVFRNPLADPYLIGVAAGAGLGATVMLATPLGNLMSITTFLPIAAFVGALLAVFITYSGAKNTGGLPITTLILAGVAVSSLMAAATTLIMMLGDDDLRPILSWLLGGFIEANWTKCALTVIYVLPAAALIVIYGRVLNVMQLEEGHANQMGVNTERTKFLLILGASLATAGAVSFSGLIGFVGLIAPHAVRLIWGTDYRTLIPMAALSGAGILIIADLTARTIISPTELPVGVVTAFFGAPFFLYLLRRGIRFGL